MEFRLSEKQREYWRDSGHRWNIKYGATRSGKTYLDYFLIPRRIRERAGLPGRIVLLGNTRGTLQRNVIDPMAEIFGPGMVGRIGQDGVCRMFGEKVYCMGADSKRAVDRLRGASIKYCYGDEVVSWDEEVFGMVKSRLDKPYSCFDGTCNPKGPEHWFKKFIDSDADIFVQQYAIDDNPFLDGAVKEALKKEHRGVFYERYILGCWVQAEGLVFPEFARGPEKWLISAREACGGYEKVCIGVDFGGNQSAHAFVCVGFSRHMHRAYVLDEFYLKQEISPEKLEQEFIRIVKRMQKLCPVYEAFCDNAESTLICGLRRAVEREGLALEVRKAKKDKILERIRFTNAMLAQKRLFVRKECRYVMEAMQNAVWDESKTEDTRLDNGTVNVDSLDAMEYALEPYMRVMLESSSGERRNT